MHKNTENLNNVNNKYKIVRYGQWWYGILNAETDIMLRVGPNPNYNGPLDNKENKLLLFKSKEKAQEYIDNNLNQVTSSQGQILSQGDLSEYKISDKELEEVRAREIEEAMANKEKFKFTGKNNGRTIEYEAEGMSLSDAVETFMRIYPDAEDWEVAPLNEAVMDPEYAYKVRKHSDKPIVLYGYRYKHGPQVGLDPEELTEEEFEIRKGQIISDYNSASRKAKEGDFMFYIFYKSIPSVEENLKLVKEDKSTMKWNIGSNKLLINDDERALLTELAKKLEDNSPNNYKYKVESTYEDFGAGMQWVTIVCYGKGSSWQVLNTAEWLDLMNTGDVESVYQSIISDKYFQDKAGEESWFKLLNKLD